VFVSFTQQFCYQELGCEKNSDAPTRRLESASRSRSGHRREGRVDTCTTRCLELACRSDAAINLDTASDT